MEHRSDADRERDRVRARPGRLRRRPAATALSYDITATLDDPDHQ
jgi:hypothetical protein